MPGVLQQIAAQMWSEARERGSTQRRLSGGLLIGCRVDGSTRQLGLSRGATRVPFDEAAIACAAFGVPRAVQRDDTGMLGELWAFWTWEHEAEQLSMFGGEAPA